MEIYKLVELLKTILLAPVNIQAGSESAAQNRLKMSVNVNTYYNQNDSIGLNNSAF